ncbi:uncharacterized protein KQ657_003329 [Scheffersomyces spartinae]|uniref:Uncharacterized protein n=1 Tax=Scheffersomyces spartinae TaxID=45513 RepID=A0A9P7VD16_9ASCO|nr:uncharacterized protein KQ657_003329 [Scheffersomyces spartinae]KAG7195562.1 hypothetical protein KQ657_003329 [Scheffersomyces spartinae]
MSNPYTQNKGSLGGTVTPDLQPTGQFNPYTSSSTPQRLPRQLQSGSPYDSQLSPGKRSLNPYEEAKRKSMVDKQHKEMFLDSMKVITDADTDLNPDYLFQEDLKRRGDHRMKIVVVGDGGCGKTCLLTTYTKNKFPELYVPTVFESYVINAASPQGKVVELALWDTAGQEEYDRIRPLSYPDVDALLLCFSLSNTTSLNNVRDKWISELNYFCPNVPICLVGTKSDLPNEVPLIVGIAVAKEIGAIAYVECSAKNMKNVRTSFNICMDNHIRQIAIKEQMEKSARKRHSLFGGSHSRNNSSIHSKGHLKGNSYDLSVHLDGPLVEENDALEPVNPYGNFTNHRVEEDEFSFARRDQKKKRRCVIL